MDCKTAEKLIPDFIRGRMETRTAKDFLEHVKKCPSCKEELSIQFLVTVGMERLEDGEAFNLNKELAERIAVAEGHVRIRQRLQWGLYYFEAFAVLAAILVMTTLVF
ncbi:MAG TPA: zf-HC2 domain-containing protein [Candidatus Eisenbergiella merdipullorum]|uniref:Zf-HC2 domain-containing protein n=1 Tax=Candidatus Eisenbergiella merdipullorum TaxID=2838553 RepID=A0A9D2I651_9FIRM|nr:zf-HC2 domain-containing protein [Candidatus Eisenbergiella merdipullorum]